MSLIPFRNRCPGCEASTVACLCPDVHDAHVWTRRAHLDRLHDAEDRARIAAGRNPYVIMERGR